MKEIWKKISEWFKNRPTKNKRIMILWEDNKALYKEMLKLQHENGYLLGQLNYIEKMNDENDMISEAEWENIIKEIEEYEGNKE